MKRVPIKRRSAPHRTTAIRTQNRKRKASEFARCYHSRERVAWVKGLSCSVLGCKRGPIENAHSESEGMGYKASYTRILPLCRYHHGYVHLVGVDSFEDRFAVNLGLAAHRTQELWLAHLRQAGRARQETDRGD